MHEAEDRLAIFPSYTLEHVSEEILMDDIFVTMIDIYHISIIKMFDNQSSRIFSYICDKTAESSYCYIYLFHINRLTEICYGENRDDSASNLCLYFKKGRRGKIY